MGFEIFIKFNYWNEISLQNWRNYFSSSGAETGTFWKYQVNIMVADALAPYVARPSAAMVLMVWDKQALVFHGERFQLPAPSKCWEIKQNIFSCFLKYIFQVNICCKMVVSRPRYYINGLVQDCSISIANALEILQPCTKPSRYCVQLQESEIWHAIWWSIYMRSKPFFCHTISRNIITLVQFHVKLWSIYVIYVVSLQYCLSIFLK